ncbi:MAG: hypothetical protein ACN4G0_07755 [Polyangiales bacterium]
MPRLVILPQPVGPRRLGTFVLAGLVAAALSALPATSYAQDGVYQGNLGGKRAQLEVRETPNGIRGALRVGKAKVNLRGKRDGKQFVGHLGPKSANVRFRAKPKGDAIVLTLIESGKKPQTVTLRRVGK